MQHWPTRYNKKLQDDAQQDYHQAQTECGHRTHA
jgi:hypothetical protein